MGQIVINFFLAYTLGIIHECCHLGVAKALRLSIERFSFWIWGTGMVINPIPFPQKEFLVSLAGPAFHLFMIPVFGSFPRLRVMNETMLMVNLLPVLPLDGGRMLKSALLCVLPVRKTQTVCRVLSWIVGTVLFCLVALHIIVLRRMTAAIFFVLFLLLSVHRTEEEFSFGLMKRLAGNGRESKKIGNVYALGMDMYGRSVLKEVFVNKENLYILVEDQRVTGIMSEHMILHGLGKWGSEASLRKIFRESVENHSQIG